MVSIAMSAHRCYVRHQNQMTKILLMNLISIYSFVFSFCTAIVVDFTILVVSGYFLLFYLFVYFTFCLGGVVAFKVPSDEEKGYLCCHPFI